MNQKYNTYILSGFDKEQTEFLSKSLHYISTKLDIDNEINIIEKLDTSIEPNDFIILFLDELSLSQLNNPINKSFIEQKKYRAKQIILILDEVNIGQLPSQFQYFPAYPIISKLNESYFEEDEIDNKEKGSIQLIEVLYDIAYYIKRSKITKSEDQSLVFVGPYDDNTTFEFHKITRELLHRECHITPTVSNPSGKELLENEVYFIEVLKSVELSIHFIGYESLLAYPEKESPALLINKIVANFCKTPEGEHIQRIIYIPAPSDDTSELIRQKISLFKSDLIGLQNAEIIQTPVEKFKEVVIAKLAELTLAVSGKEIYHNTIDDIYIIHPPGISNEIKKYTDWFDSKNIIYSTSQVDLDQLDLLNYHQKKLTNCKGVLIYNDGNTQWLSRKLSDLKKSPGWGRKKPFSFKMVIGNDKFTDINKHFDESISYFEIGNSGLFSEIEKFVTQ
ncbi:MAG: hypothetical protein JEZ09_13950 [Salinivirgaceae bacterium]|nr:hypothetical protein [Salinivirgaceae bacterium]